MRWHDEYVAAGQTTDGGRYVGGTFVSADGLHWERTSVFLSNPTLVVTDTSLIAVVTTDASSKAVRAWTSGDARTWQPRDALGITGATIERLTARGSTIIGTGTDTSGRALMWRSVGGAAWARTDLPSARAIVRDLVTVTDGFIALGRDGDPDVATGGVGVPGVGLPAAWWSSDGLAWTTLQVEGQPAAGAQLTQLFAGADGYFAIGSDSTDPSVNARAPLVWVSADARTWRLLGPRPFPWGTAGSNGERAVYFASGGRTIEARGSRDGRQWTPIPFTGDVADIPGFVPVSQGAQLDQIFVMAQGIIVVGHLVGQQSSSPMAWFVDAAPPR